MENKTFYDYVVTFTFVEPVNLDKYFVEVLEDTYGKENVRRIDQSTYGITGVLDVDMDCMIHLISKAEEKGEKCKDGGELTIMTADNVKKQIISSSLIFQSRLNKIR